MRFLIALCVLLASAAAQAKIVLYVPAGKAVAMFASANTQQPPQRTLTAGTAIQVVDADDKTGLARIRLLDNSEGWVTLRELTTSPPTLPQTVAGQPTATSTEAATAGLVPDPVTANYERQISLLKKEMAQLKETTAQPLALAKQNQELRARAMQLETAIQNVQQENAILKDRSGRDWFLAGAAVIAIGIGIGLFIARMRPKKQGGW